MPANQLELTIVFFYICFTLPNMIKYISLQAAQKDQPTLEHG